MIISRLWHLLDLGNLSEFHSASCGCLTTSVLWGSEDKSSFIKTHFRLAGFPLPSVKIWPHKRNSQDQVTNLKSQLRYDSLPLKHCVLFRFKSTIRAPINPFFSTWKATLYSKLFCIYTCKDITYCPLQTIISSEFELTDKMLLFFFRSFKWQWSLWMLRWRRLKSSHL